MLCQQWIDGWPGLEGASPKPQASFASLRRAQATRREAKRLFVRHRLEFRQQSESRLGKRFAPGFHCEEFERKLRDP